MHKKSLLGDKLKKGKDALFGTSQDLPRIVEVDMAQLRTNPDQPRARFDKEALQELADSIDRHGLIQPITVMRAPDTEDEFIIVAGERRFRAFQTLEKETIPAIITRGNPDEIALIENIQREDLNPLEEAEALQRMMQRHGYSQEELAKVVGKARTSITELLSLTSLPEEIKSECRTSDLASKSLLIEIKRLRNPKVQLQAWSDIKQGVATVRALRDRKAPSPKQQRSKIEQLLSTGYDFLKRLEKTAAAGHHLDTSRHDELVNLYKRIGELVEKLAQTDGNSSTNSSQD